MRRKPSRLKLFQSTHPVRGATKVNYLHVDHLCISIHAPRAGCDSKSPSNRRNVLISIHAPRAGCDVNIGMVKDALDISIHAPRAGCDGYQTHRHGAFSISIHAPRAGCDNQAFVSTGAQDLFQSTHPVRGATCRSSRQQSRCCHFNPRTPCGVRQSMITGWVGNVKFQSTHPVRGATANLTVLPGQICAKGTKKSLFSRKNAQKRK